MDRLIKRFRCIHRSGGDNGKVPWRCTKKIFILSVLVSRTLLCVPNVVSCKAAQDVFDSLLMRTAVSWNALIIGYARHGLGEQALMCLEHMKLEGVAPDAITFTCSLKACGNVQDLSKGIEIHGEIVRRGLLRSDPVLGSALVDMYAKSELIWMAAETFNRLPMRNVGSWNAMISAFVQRECSKEALSYFVQMKLEGVLPNTISHACILSACGIVSSIGVAREIHAMIVGTWPIEENIMVSSAIINMYAQFGLHEQVEVSFYETHSRNVDVWNTLMSFYVNHEFSNEVLECFKRMQLEGISPDAITYTCNLKACGNVRALGKGKELHAVTTAQHQYGKNLMIGNALIHMYGKSGLLVEAHTAFEKMLHRDMISWNTLMAGYLKHDCHAEALHCFEKIEHKGISPDAFAFCCGLKACNGTGAVDKGIEIHREIERKGFLEKDLVLGNTLIDMYAKHGFLTKAQGVFDTLPEQDKVSWNTLLAGYLKFDQPKKALNCFEQMRIHGIPADALSFSYCLRACGTIGAIEKGKQTHAEVILNGLLENDLIVGIALVDMYALCGHLETAKDLSDKLDNQDAASWNARIATYAKHEQAEKALNYFNLMQSAGFSPNAIAFACSLKACASLGDTVKGRELHCDAEMRGLLETSLLVGNALVDMYAKCGQLIKAQEAFDKLPRRDVVSWNILIASHVKYGFDSEALEHLKKMQKEGFSPDVVTFVCSLKACGHIGAIAKGIELHADIKKAGLSNNVSLGTVLIDMYAKCGFIEKAQAVFDQLQSKDVKAWNALMSGLGNDDEAMLWCFEEMQSEAIRPDAATYAFALKACGHIGLLEKGWKMHKEIKRSGWLEEEIAVGNTLIDMYAKLGWIKQAREAFESLRKRDLVSWNILICGYAQLGEATQAVVHYERMKREGIEPDSVTFVNILNACSQEGLMGEAFVWFDAMLNDYDIMPTLEHLTCMVNLLCRSGRLEMAVTITLRLPIHPSVLMWCTILAASQRLGNTKLARYAFEQVMQLDGGEVAAYVIMYNTYAGS